MNKILRWSLIIIGTLVIFVIALVLYFGVFSVAKEKNWSLTGERAFLWTVDEGDGFETNSFSGPSFIVNNACKLGLKAVSAAKEVGGKFSCVYPMCGCYVCTKCGDGICGKGENSCNCKEDCQPGEGEKSSMQDVYNPVAYKSDDFVDTGISYDSDYDRDKDRLVQLIDKLDKYIFDMNTHNYKDGGGAFSGGQGEENFGWTVSSQKPKIELTGKYVDYEGLDSKERERAHNVMQINGFQKDDTNSMGNIIGYKKTNLVCLFQEKLEKRGAKITCGDLDNPNHDITRYRRSD